MFNIAFTSTAYGPMWPPAVSSWLGVVAYTSRYCTVHTMGKVGQVGITDRMYTHSAQNRIIKDCLEEPDLTHIFMTEMDMILPDHCIMDLLALDKDIASGIYFIRNGNGQPCLYKRAVNTKENPYTMSPVTLFPTKEPFKFNGNPGLGCVLMKKEVFDKIDFPWFDLKESYYGSDMFFYTKASKAGVEVWCHPKVMCWQIDYTCVGPEDYFRRLNEDPNFAKNGYIVGYNKD